VITYNEVIKRIKIIFSEFGVELDNFYEKVNLNSLGLIGDALASELEIALREEFDVNQIISVYDGESTIEEIINEIMEQYNGLHHNENNCIEISEDDNITGLIIMAVIVMIILAIIFFL